MAANYQFIGDDAGFNLIQLDGASFVSAKRFAKGEVILEVTATTTKLTPTADEVFTVANALISSPIATTPEDLFTQLNAIIY